MDSVKLWLIYMIEYHVAITIDDISILVNQKKQSDKANYKLESMTPTSKKHKGISMGNHPEGFPPKCLSFYWGGGILYDFNFLFLPFFFSACSAANMYST